MKLIRLIELFAGIGSQSMALRDLGIPFEYHKVIEIDKYAIKSYNAIHGTSFEPSDITKINSEDLQITNTNSFTYLLTYSFPCQDLSLSGKQAGMKKGDNTRSGLLWEVERILLECEKGNCLPQILLMENVPQVHNKKNIDDFEGWIGTLEFLGYKNYYDDLNAKDFAIPQSRNRCFMVSVLNDCIPAFHFPRPMVLEHTMKDFLEEEVDEKYYIYSDKVKELISKLIADRQLLCQSTDQGLSNKQTVFQQKQIEELATKQQKEAVLLKSQGSEMAGFTDTAYCLLARNYKGFGNQISNGVIEYKKINRLEKRKDGCTNSITTVWKDIDVSDKFKECVWEIDDEVYLIRIRKLTPKECYRLMGFSDEDFEKAESVNSNTQLYKQAGNSIVKNVLMAIFYQLFKEEIEINPCKRCKWECEEENCNECYLIQKLSNPCCNCGFDCNPEDKEQCEEYKKWLKVNAG